MSDQTEGDGGSAIIEPVGAAVDKARHESKKKIQARKDREDREFFRLVLSSEAGRRFLWAILDECKTFTNQFAFGPAGFPDAHETFFHLGERDVGQRLYHTWHAKAPAEVMQMLMENDTRFKTVEA